MVVDQGQAKVSGIYIAPLPEGSVLRYAAQDLAAAIETMSGARLEMPRDLLSAESASLRSWIITV